jgi:nifR3 family TIM-barrel protein
MAKQFPKLKGKLMLAPMHGITNIAFRILCKRYGACLVSTELLSANAIAKNNKAALKLARTDKEEKPVSIQLFSQNTENIIKAAKMVEEGFDIIDFNLGCPSTKILGQGSGAALLRRKNRIREIVKETSNAISKPFTVKIRAGFNREINAVEIAKLCEESGACAITIHPRTVEQGYSGKADWKIIKQVKEAVKIPVIGNGDVVDGESAKRMFEETGCDYVMIGRAAMGNPFIFKEIEHYLKTGETIKQGKVEKINDFYEYIRLAQKYEVFSKKDAKLKAQDFTKGISGSKRIRRELNNVSDWEEIERLVKRIG